MNEWETCIDEWAERLRVSRQETADAHATIAYLQGQVAGAEKAYQEKARLWIEQTGAVSALQQRVAQLEGERDALKRDQFAAHACAKTFEQMSDEASLKRLLSALQADHARVLGLVQALPMAGLPVEHARSDDFVVLQTNGEWMAHTYNYWAKFATEEEAQAYIALLEYRASLPAQPVQGGAGTGLYDSPGHDIPGATCL